MCGHAIVSLHGDRTRQGEVHNYTHKGKCPSTAKTDSTQNKQAGTRTSRRKTCVAMSVKQKPLNSTFAVLVETVHALSEKLQPS